MGLFDRSKQVVTTTNNISSTDISSTETTNIQDSGNTITSITDAFKSSASWLDQSVFSQPIAIMAGGASSGFDANGFFDSANAIPGKAVEGNQSIVPGIVKLVLIGVVVWLALKYFRGKK